MSRILKKPLSLCTALVVTSFLALAGSVSAEPAITDATFSGPVQLPNVLLSAGSYRFARADNSQTVVVSDADGRIIGIFAITPIARARRGDVVALRPSVAGAAPEISAMYSEGGTQGFEFVYRKAKK